MYTPVLFSVEVSCGLWAKYSRAWGAQVRYLVLYLQHVGAAGLIFVHTGYSLLLAGANGAEQLTALLVENLNTMTGY
jgi:hypothetical protein